MPENTSRVTGARQSPRSVRHPSVTETVLYSFGGSQAGDGGNPEGGLTYLNGTLYGTTENGGKYYSGTVYSITPSGTETVLHSFTGGLDGASPVARLIVLKGTLYGTTPYGGYDGGKGGGPCSQLADRPRAGFGTVFSITPSGQETTEHTFRPAREGWWPRAALLNVNGTLYGTTCGGGSIHTNYSGGYGTVFTITPSGDEHAIYSFQFTGGAWPSHGRLLDLNGTLYGTASGGGKYAFGAVFSLSTSGREKLLHSFKYQGRSKDGYNPVGGLTAIKHTLYGTTQLGGTHDDGTVFSITPTGTETVLHSFNGSDGSGPVATLLNVNGTLYGTTSSGGAYNDGTVFSITLSGHETVLYSFMGQGTGRGQDGADPLSGLDYVNGTFYGTTYSGGAYDSGTVYSITL
jgi:uncharacterized repeat protein (TIGR03803 family)